MILSQTRKIELIVLDLDGTLLMGNGRIHPNNIQPIKTAIARGIPVVLATGKTRASALELIDTLGLTTPGVFSQGMTIYDANGVIQRLVLLETAVIQKAITYCTKRKLPLIAYSPDGLWSLADDDYRHILHTKFKEPLPELCPELGQKLDNLRVTKLLISDEQDTKMTRADLESLVGDQAVVVQAVAEYLEVMPLGVSKGEGVRWLLEKMNVNPANVMAMGDGENDLEMLQMVGLGVAMGNAHNGVKAVADMVVGTNESAGVAEAIERFVLD